MDESLTLFENCQRLKKAKKIDELKKFGTKVDHSKWDMPGHMVGMAAALQVMHGMKDADYKAFFIV